MASSAEHEGSNASVEADFPPQHIPNLQELLKRNWATMRQFADICRVQYRTALRWQKTGHIRPVKVGGQWRIYEDEIRRFLTEGSHSPKE